MLVSKMCIPKITFFIVGCLTYIICSTDVDVKTEEDLGVKYANRCEVCKVLATELQNRLEETGKVHDVIEIGYSLDDVQPKKKTKYQKSELRLIESLDGVCEKILEYNIHKERQDSTRFAKGMSQTFKTLHGLVDKGVKVDLGIPYELWDKPSAEITHLKTQCESLLEENEDAIEYWYWNLQGTKDLKHHLCSDHALKNADMSCLYENGNFKGDIGKSFETENEPKQMVDSAETIKEEQPSINEFEQNLGSAELMEDEEPIATPSIKFEQIKTQERSTPKSQEELDREKAAKEKFVKLYQAGLVDFTDPDLVIDFDELRRLGKMKAIEISPEEKRRLRKQYIKEGLLKKPDMSGWKKENMMRNYDLLNELRGDTKAHEARLAMLNEQKQQQILGTENIKSERAEL